MNKETLRPTKDDWYPSFIQNGKRFCKVFLVKYPKQYINYPGFKVGVWGDDDFGLDKEFWTYEEALEVYQKITAMDFVSKDELKLDFGFDIS